MLGMSGALSQPPMVLRRAKGYGEVDGGREAELAVWGWR